MAITLGRQYVTSNLMCYLDSTNSTSYPGTGTTWYDLSGNGRNGTLTNSPTYSSNAINFNGTNQYVSLGNIGLLPTQGTISFMMNSSVWENYRNPFASKLNGSNAGFRWEQSGNGTFGVLIGNDAGSYLGYTYASAGLVSGVPYYVTITWDKTTSTVVGYLNGVQKFSSSSHTTWPGSLSDVAIGNGFSSDRYFKGSILHTSIYNRALTSSEILQNYGAYGITFSDGNVLASTYSASTTDKGKLIQIDKYSTSGSYTWNKPSGCQRVLVKVVGAGGGAAGHCESGGGGGYSEKLIDVSSISSVTVTVGAGGAAVSYYAVGGNGGTSSFGSYCSATGGYGANQNQSHTGGHGGVGSSGDVNLLGGTGTGHGNNGSQQCLGVGGISYWGGGRKLAHNNSNPSNTQYNVSPGSGAPGANQGYNYIGADAGMVVVYSYY